MFKRTLMLLALVGLAVAGGLSRGQDDKTKDPVSKHGLTLKLRKAAEGRFTKETKSHGLEVFQDANNKYGVYISETGGVAAINADLFKAGEGKVKDPEWAHAMWLNARKAGERDWDKGKKFGIEVFKDENNGNLIYVNENVQISVVPSKYVEDNLKKGDKPKDPKWRYSFDFPVRKAGEKDQEKAKKIGVEVFKDENNGNLIYITETGSISVVAGKLLSKDDKDKGAPFQHAMELSARKSTEKNFGKDTKRYGVEVFLDNNNGNVIYIAENGNVSVVPGKLAKSGEKDKDPESKHGLTMSVRPAAEKSWDKAKAFGVEAYMDGNNGNWIYITEAGELSVVSPKSE